MSVRLIVAALAICVAPIVTPAADNDDYNPYKNVKVGDFATYKINVKVAGQNIAGSTTQSITAKSDKEATVKVVSSVGGMEIPAQMQTIDLTKPFDPTKAGGGLPAGVEGSVTKDKDGKEKVKVGGKEYDTTWTTYKVKAKAGGMDIKSDIKVWMSKDIVLGIVKMDMTADIADQKMEMTMEVTDFTGNKK
ncbi:MAG TPA: hypothetical protein VG122_12265 [Gemmata sp.]|jgi:hypothetical protein|nr:hypothetical protein [Gemmata sp.]